MSHLPGEWGWVQKFKVHKEKRRGGVRSDGSVSGVFGSTEESELQQIV